jgi:hypothetical protein
VARLSMNQLEIMRQRNVLSAAEVREEARRINLK